MGFPPLTGLLDVGGNFDGPICKIQNERELREDQDI
jgi:hypothetical protein